MERLNAKVEPLFTQAKVEDWPTQRFQNAFCELSEACSRISSTNFLQNTFVNLKRVQQHFMTPKRA
jgi:hypothetical protein